MNHPVALEMILQYVSEIEICISFQQISLDTYITALNSMQYPHVPYQVVQLDENNLNVRIPLLADNAAYLDSRSDKFVRDRVCLHIKHVDFCMGMDFSYGWNSPKQIVLYDNLDNPLLNIGTEEYNLDFCSVIKFVGFYRVSTIDDEFLCGARGLVRLDLSNFLSLQSIGDRFLMDCDDLETLIFPKSAKIRKIGLCMLVYCRSLKKIIWPEQIYVQDIPSEFMSNCKSIKSIDTKIFKNVVSIDTSFMEECSSLHSINLEPFAGITDGPGNFLFGCESLTFIDLRPLKNVTFVYKGFLRRTDNLLTIDITGLDQDLDWVAELMQNSYCIFITDSADSVVYEYPSSDLD